MNRSSGRQSGGAWIVKLNAVSCPRLRLLLAPHAGGGSSTYLSWRPHAPDDVELLAVQLPGRERRLGEAPLADLRSVAAEVARALAFLPDDLPVALFGHSFGAFVCFEVARDLLSVGRRPHHLFVSACRAPNLPARSQPLHALPDVKFVEALRRLNGTPEEVLTNAELMSLLLPAIRADFAAFETYRHRVDAPLDVPITAFGGSRDGTVTTGELMSWQILTRRAFRLRFFPGDHFFPGEARKSLLASILEDCNGRRSMGRKLVGGFADDC